MSKLLSVKEAASELRLSEDSIYKLCALRKLRHERHGLKKGRIRIPEEAIAEYRTATTVKTSVEEPGRNSPAPPRQPLQLKHLKLASRLPSGAPAVDPDEGRPG